MDKVALVLAVIAVGVVGYDVFGAKAEAGPPAATEASVTALAAEVRSLEQKLAAAEVALGEAREAERLARGEAEAASAAKVEGVAAALASLDARVGIVESRRADAGGSLVAEELILKTKEGQTVMRLGAREKGGGEVRVFAKTGKLATLLFARGDDDGELALYDHTGELRANIGGNDVGGYANFYSRSGSLAAYLGGDEKKDSGYIAVYGKDKQELVGLYGNPKGGVVSVRNKATRKQIVMIGAAPNNGMGFVGLGTDEGKPALAHFVTRNGGQMKTLNADGETATFIGVSADPAGNGLLYISNKRGERIFECGATEGSGGYASFHNGQKERVLFLGASSGTDPHDGVVEVARRNGKLGVVLRAYHGGSSVRIYDNSEKVIKQLR